MRFLANENFPGGAITVLSTPDMMSFGGIVYLANTSLDFDSRRL
jgi:hypothetical protein